MLALDPLLEELEQANYAGSSSTYQTASVYKYNPYETLKTMPRTYYECMSLLDAFSVISCPGEGSQDTCCIMDLDTSGGCAKAIRSRYPRASVFSLETRRTPRTLKEYLLSRNRFGADFAFCVDNEAFDLERQVRHATEALFVGSILVLRVDSIYSSRVANVIDNMLYMYKQVGVYKCATMSCVRDECYVVGLDKLMSPSEKPTYLQGVEVVEEFTRMSRSSVLSRVDNTHIAKPESLVASYLMV